MDIQKIKQRLHNIFGAMVVLKDGQTYVKMITPMVFIDIEYGEWRTTPNNVLNKRCVHPKRKLEKRKKTLLAKYGVDNAFKSEKVKQKIKESLITKYGGDHPMKIKTIKDKTKSTCQERYGTNSPLESDIIKTKIKNTTIDRYGVTNPRIETKNKVKVHILPNGYPLSDYIKKYNKIKHYPAALKTYKKHGFDILKEYIEGDKVFLRTTNIECVVSNLLNLPQYNRYIGKRKPDFKLANDTYLDIDGLYWHCENRGRYYHYDKRTEYENLGFRLIQIRENEIFAKQQASMSLIHRILGLTISIQGEDCKIQNVEQSYALNFLNINHLKPCTEKTHCLGLYDNSSLVTLVCFKKSIENNIEITHYSDLNGFNTLNGLTILVKEIRKNYKPPKIYTWADLRYEIDYDYVGFTPVKDIIGWAWTDFEEVYECPINKRYAKRIYDAGQRLFVKTYI